MNRLTEHSKAIGSIAWRLGIKPEIIASVLARQAYPQSLSRFYRRFIIPKSRNRKRVILAPQGGLRTIQNAIYQRLLRDQKCSDIAHGFVPDRSVITALLPHHGARIVFLADMKDAFASVPKKVVRRLMKEFGFKGAALGWMVMFVWEKEYGLPQGAPTSGMLFNMACQYFDRGLKREAEKYGYQVTRYADNIIISSAKDEFPISFKWNAHNVLTVALWEDRSHETIDGYWIKFGVGDWDREKIYGEISENRPGRVLGAILTGDDARLSGKTLRHLRIRAYNAVLADDQNLLNGIKGYLLPWFGEIPPQVAAAIRKAQSRLESISAP